MNRYSVKRCSGLEALNKSLVEGEINFDRTVLFSAEIDLTEIEKIRSSSPEADRPSYTAFVTKAASKALLEFPYANRRLFHLPGLPFLSFFQSFTDVDVAVAVERDVEGSHAVAYMEIIRDPHAKSLSEITRLLRGFSDSDLNSSEQWRSFHALGTRVPGWLGGLIARLPFYFPKLWRRYRGGTTLISSPAKYGVDGIVAAWPHPLSYSFGLAQKKPMVKGDQVVAVQAFTFVLDWDRRVMAGAQAARFFSRVCGLLRDPKELLS